MEAERRRANMEKLRRDMEKTKGQTVVLSTGLKDKEPASKMMEEDNEEEEEEEDEYIRFSEEDEEDEEVAHFAF